MIVDVQSFVGRRVAKAVMGHSATCVVVTSASRRVNIKLNEDSDSARDRAMAYVKAGH